MPGGGARGAARLWKERDRGDEYVGTLVNAVSRAAAARSCSAGEAYVDVGTLHGYREATQLLDARRDAWPAGPLPTPLKAVARRSA